MVSEGWNCLRHVIGRCGSRSIIFAFWSRSLYSHLPQEEIINSPMPPPPHDQPCSGLPTVVRPSFRIFLS